MTKRYFQVGQSMLVLITLGVVFCSFYFQYAKGLEPCPLCLMQRLCACGVLFVSLIGLFLGRFSRAKYMLLFQGVFAGLGLFFALRQLWLQLYASHEATACLPGLDMLIHYFPWRELVHVFFWGSSTCSEVAWYGLGLSMAAWSAFYFGFVLLIGGLFVFL